MTKPRNEARILHDLALLTASPGYVHAIAHFCHRDNALHVEGTLKASDINQLDSRERLIRTEQATLIGLMAKQPMDLVLPPEDVVRSYVERTDALMRELHNAMSYPTMEAMRAAMLSGGAMPDPWAGPGLREPIFYGTESAYPFQYRDFVPEKYGADDDWLLDSKGFTSGQAKTVAWTICTLIERKGAWIASRNAVAQPETWLPAFEFSVEEVAHHSGVVPDVVAAFVRAFQFTGDNARFKEVGDFNEVAARPILPTGRGTFLLFSHYSIYEALYESPFFWMLQDKSYQAQAAKHRGAFTEEFAQRRLAGVFGRQHVYTNVNLYRGKDIVGEVDVLVVYADRVIIVQAKSKKLTIAARKGNDGQLKADFAAAIQHSYDQGWHCAQEIVTGGCRLVDHCGREVDLPERIKEVFLFSVVSEHYPALAFQARQFLKSGATDVVRPPFVMDVFLLDTLTEMLATPLHFLSYVRMRVAVADRLLTGHELTVLGYHLKQKLWLDRKHDMVILEDSIAADLDVAMIVRREHVPGDRTPAGVLTRMRGTLYERLIGEIERRAEPATLALGLHLLSMDEDACRNVHRGLEAMTRKARLERTRQDMTLAAGTGGGGICFHCNPVRSIEAIGELKNHCEMRKYAQRAAQWFGVSVDTDGYIQFGISLDFPWERNEEMDRLTAGMKEAARATDVLPDYARAARRQKLGRNAPCVCGSGRKYKRCCLN
ncbi:SEC-C metal-binding domain-containing protein [Paraburkholderia tropica]|uniref:SEC-C metal-binding domain-containing protein n=1 Tax=Paraburkholderia tropica TaxID=92647 RepID=UPI002AB0B026|nr:SEC-C metal-binding domain-containing protein [Paraburkholderia tropica]